jgi:hypothetical protein
MRNWKSAVSARDLGRHCDWFSTRSQLTRRPNLSRAFPIDDRNNPGPSARCSRILVETNPVRYQTFFPNLQCNSGRFLIRKRPEARWLPTHRRLHINLTTQLSHDLFHHSQRQAPNLHLFRQQAANTNARISERMRARSDIRSTTCVRGICSHADLLKPAKNHR